MTATIEQIEAWVGGTLPSSYLEFLDSHLEDILVSDYVVLYGRSSVIERNTTNETKRCCPGYVTVGNDSGDEEFVISLAEGSISMVDGGSMRPEEAEFVASDFAEWLAADCPVPEFQHDPVEWLADPTDQVCIFLERPPSRLASLIMIKKELGLATSIAVLKQSLNQLPVQLSECSYAAARNRCLRVNSVDPCLGIRLASDISLTLPVEYQRQAPANQAGEA